MRFPRVLETNDSRSAANSAELMPRRAITSVGEWRRVAETRVRPANARADRDCTRSTLIRYFNERSIFVARRFLTNYRKAFVARVY